MEEIVINVLSVCVSIIGLSFVFKSSILKEVKAILDEKIGRLKDTQNRMKEDLEKNQNHINKVEEKQSRLMAAVSVVIDRTRKIDDFLKNGKK